MTTSLRLFAVLWLVSGCTGLKTDLDIAKERAQTYLVAHPNLASNAAEAIRANTILVGMTMEQVTAAWGRPAEKEQYRDGAVQYWFFGCDWPHYCTDPDRDNRRDLFPAPDSIYQSRALFENGRLVEWQD